MNRLDRLFAEARLQRRKVLSLFTTFGFPSLRATAEVLRLLDREGVDLVELGFPFSDPLADGPTIQASSEHAIGRGVHLADLFRLVRRLRAEGVCLPIMLFSYTNPLLTFGLARAVREMKRSGLDGVMIPDLATEEAPAVRARLRRAGLAYVAFLAPTSSRERVARVSRLSHPFVYYVSRKGVTGERDRLAPQLASHLRWVRRKAGKPVLVGFGISRPEHVRTVLREAEGVIVGSAFITALARARGRVQALRPFVRRLLGAVRAASQ